MDEPSVVPFCAFEGAGEDDLGQAVHVIGDHTGCGLPICGHAFVGDATEEQGSGLAQLFDGELFLVLVKERMKPLHVPTCCVLKVSIKGEHVPLNQFAHCHSPWEIAEFSGLSILPRRYRDFHFAAR